MINRGRFKISLAAKCRMLFGLAVLAIIAAALFVPADRMEKLVHEVNARTVKEMALAARAHSDLPGGDWKVKQAELEKWWPTYAETHELPVSPAPQLIQLDPLSKSIPSGATPFLQQSITMMREHADVDEAFDWGRGSDGTTTYQAALAVRRKEDHKLAGVVTASYQSIETTAELWKNRAVMIAAGALAGLLALLVFYLITQKLILSPVRELRRVSEQVAGGDLAVRSTTATGDEFEDLARAFNDMLTHLQASQEALRAMNKSLDIKLDELAQANVGLFEANRLKGEFLANVSHELRTPMTSIIGFAELLKEAHEGQDGRLARYAHNILTSGRMLLDIINDLLDIAKIEAGKMEVRLERVDLKSVCSDLTDFVRPLADQARLKLVLDLPDELPLMVSDTGKIKQILYNLLSNAIKFTPEGGQVTLSAAQAGSEMIAMAVSDTGPGIPADQLETIFEKFLQIDQSKTREHSGTGLGLAISRELATILGGSIKAESKVGTGSTFTVTLPVRAPQANGTADRRVVTASAVPRI
jgi:two-component system sensor histidine kinase BarA